MLLAALAAPASAQGAGGLPTDRPLNVLFILSDQHTTRALGCYENGFGGLTESLTPNLDRLAAEGVRFESAACPAPICCPSRFSTLTGRWPHHTGLRHNNVWEPYGEVTFPEIARRVGYATGTVGKHHMNWLDQTPLFQDLGFDVIVDLNDYDRFCLGNGVPPYAKTGNYWGMPAMPGTLVGRTGYSFNANELHPAGYWADQVLGLLEERAGPGGDGAPFVYWYSNYGPHTPILPSGPADPHDFAHLYHPFEGLALPPNQDKVATTDALAGAQEIYAGLDDDQWREVLSYYYGYVSQIDANVGRVLDRLDELGLADTTVVVYTADHGEMASEMGCWAKATGHYDAITRVPLIVRLPEVLPAGRVVAEPVNLIDLFPTLAELTGVPLEDALRVKLDGRSLVGLMVDDVAPADWPEATFSEIGPRPGKRSWMVRTETAKYVWHEESDQREYYDLVQDPWEIEDRYDDPDAGVQATIAELEQRFDDWWDDENGHAPFYTQVFELDDPPSAVDQPDPRDGSNGVPRDVDPRWVPSTAAFGQTVYFGTDPALPKPFRELASMVDHFNPGTLEPATTYYWRVDGHNRNGTTVGPTLSFQTTAGGSGGPELSLDPLPGHLAELVALPVLLQWTPAPSAHTQDLHFGPQGALEPVATGLAQDVASFDPGPLEAGRAYAWRVDSTDALGTTEGDVWTFTTDPAGLPARPRALHPLHMNPRAVVTANLPLRWESAPDADAYAVWFGTAEPLSLLATVTTTHLDPGPLAPGSTYLWRVDTLNALGTTRGWTQRFTTDECLGGASLGTGYCPANPTSTGSPARIEASGSSVVADDCLVLEAADLPNAQVGYFIMGRQQLSIPNPGGSAGILCTGAPLVRLLPPVRNSRQNGAFSVALDLANVPGIGVIVPGETWNFQAWFRDLGPTSNFTDGLEITFR